MEKIIELFVVICLILTLGYTFKQVILNSKKASEGIASCIVDGGC